MTSFHRRIEKIEEITGTESEPLFFASFMHPWTEQEKEIVTRKYPAIKVFWKPLSSKLPRGWERMHKEDQEFWKDMAKLVPDESEKELEERDAAIRRWVTGEELDEEMKGLIPNNGK